MRERERERDDATTHNYPVIYIYQSFASLLPLLLVVVFFLLTDTSGLGTPAETSVMVVGINSAKQQQWNNFIMV
jgi:hypothetical protein